MPARAVVLIAVLAALVTPAAAGASTPVAGTFRIAIDTAAQFPNYAESASRNQYVIMHAWQQDRMEALKQQNPNVKVLVYKNLTSTKDEGSRSEPLSRGVDYNAANANNPDWFLRNRSGQRVTTRGYGTYVMDVGNRGYQDEWARNVVAELQREGWDGVFMDDTNLTMRYHYDVDQIAKYPSDEAWQAATESMLANVGPKIMGSGKLAVPNIGSWAMYPEIGDRWLRHVSGGMDEMFTKWQSPPGEGYRWEGGWEDHLSSLKKAQASGKLYLGVAHSDNSDRAAARYGWATMLLGANGTAAFAMHGDYTNETWFPEYGYPIGTPTGGSTRDGNGVHRRTFSKGLVLVNPSSESKRVSFGGTYSGSGLDASRSASMPPNSGLLLVAQGRGSSGPPPVGSPGGPTPPAPRPPSGGPGQPKPPSAAARPSRPTSMRGKAIGRGARFQLSWDRPRRSQGQLRYVVFRNGDKVAQGRRARFLDRGVRPGERRRYVVRAAGDDGKVSQLSRRVVYRRR